MDKTGGFLSSYASIEAKHDFPIYVYRQKDRMAIQPHQCKNNQSILIKFTYFKNKKANKF